MRGHNEQLQEGMGCSAKHSSLPPWQGYGVSPPQLPLPVDVCSPLWDLLVVWPYPSL